YLKAASDLLAQLGSVLVAVHCDGVSSSGVEYLVLAAGNRERAVVLARHLAAIDHPPVHAAPPRFGRRSFGPRYDLEMVIRWRPGRAICRAQRNRRRNGS